MGELSSSLPEQRGVPQRITCPTCHASVLSENAVCPICGNQLSEAAMPGYKPPAVRSAQDGRRGKRRIVLAIVLIALASGSVAGYYAYDRFWLNNPVLNAAAEPGSASRAVDSLTLICATTSPFDRSDPSRVTGYITLGVRNRSGYPMSTNWTLSTYYPSVNVLVTSSQAFHLAGMGDAHPKFQITITSAQIDKLRSSPNGGADAVTSMSRTFNVTGIHGTYRFTRYDTSSATNTGTGILVTPIGGDVGKVLGPPPCP